MTRVPRPETDPETPQERFDFLRQPLQYEDETDEQFETRKQLLAKVISMIPKKKPGLPLPVVSTWLQSAPWSYQ